MTRSVTFTFNSEDNECNVAGIIQELICDPLLYEKAKAFENENVPFQIEYTFADQIDGRTIGIGGGEVDSEEENEDNDDFTKLAKSLEQNDWEDS